MNIVIANSQKWKIIEGGRAFLNSLELRLCLTNVAISGTVMPVVETDEPTDSGYAVEANPYPNAFATVGTQAVADGISPTYVFAHDAGDFTLYACFFTDPADGDVTVMACLADAPFTVVAPGQVFIVPVAFVFDTYTP